LWEQQPQWQPLRELVERLLVTWDWGEAFIGTAFAFAPRFDALFLGPLARWARRAGDDVLDKVLFSLAEDSQWHRQWSAALVGAALRDCPENHDVITEWLAKWDPLATR